MRDTIRSKEYFDTFILEEEEDGIKMFEESIANGEIEEDRIDFIKDDILLIKLGVIIAKYSRGDSVKLLKQEFENMLDMFYESWDSQIYEDNLCFASMAYLLGLDSTQLIKIKEKLMESEEYDYLIDFVLVGAETTLDKANVSFPQPYKKLLRSIECNDKEYLKKYLRGWYKGCRESSWYDTHLIEDDNLYFGYWCFEAGAIAKRLGFNDEDLKDEQYYPYDMVHFL